MHICCPETFSAVAVPRYAPGHPVACAIPPDHAPFLFDGRICEGDGARPVVQDQQAGVDNALASDRSVHDHVDRFVETCISVEVLTSAHPDGFPVNSSMPCPGKFFCSVERHVFKEMGESALVLVSQDRSDILGDKEIRTVFRLCIVSDDKVNPLFSCPYLIFGSMGKGCISGCCAAKRREASIQRKHPMDRICLIFISLIFLFKSRQMYIVFCYNTHKPENVC